MAKFNVTYERWNESAYEAGDTDDRGFVIENVSLTDAIRLGLEARNPSWLGHCEPNDSNVTSARWFTWTRWNDGTRENIEQGIDEQRSLHIPESVTLSSRRRIARLFGLRA